MIAISALLLVALAIAIPPIVWKPTRFLPHGANGSAPSGSDTLSKARDAAPPPSEPTVFRFFQENPTNLDAALASDAYSSTVIAQIYSPLVGLTSNLEPTPQVADSWTISRDGLTYIFHIREGVRFHNGRPVTAGDFAYSLTRVFTEPFLGRAGRRIPRRPS
jgi:ABC-type transport system substrate-binding protein